MRDVKLLIIIVKSFKLYSADRIVDLLFDKKSYLLFNYNMVKKQKFLKIN